MRDCRVSVPAAFRVCFAGVRGGASYSPHLQVAVHHLRLQPVQVLQRARDAECDPHPLPARERVGARAAGGHLARQPVAQRPARAQLEHQAALRAVDGQGQQPADVHVPDSAKLSVCGMWEVRCWLVGRLVGW